MDIKVTIVVLVLYAAVSNCQQFTTPSTTRAPTTTLLTSPTTKPTIRFGFTTPTTKRTITALLTTPTTRSTTTSRFTTPRTTLFTTPTTTITPASKDSCSCQRLELTGPEKYHAAAMGSYRLEKCLYNNKPLYKHIDRDLFLYFSTQNVWAVGLAPDQGVMVLRVGDMAETPANVTLDWSVMDGMNTTVYKTAPNVKTRCGCRAYICEKLTMISRSTRASISGEFIRQGELNGRPTYVNREHGVYLYLKRTPSCAYWAVGSTLDGDSPLMVTNDVAPTPDEITSNWNVHYKTSEKTEWARADITLSCLSKAA